MQGSSHRFKDGTLDDGRLQTRIQNKGVLPGLWEAVLLAEG